MLSCMPNPKHLHLVAENLIYRDVRPRREQDFASIFGQADSPAARKRPQRGNSVENGLCHPNGAFRIFSGNVFDNARQILGSGLGPTNIHLRTQNSLDALHDFVVVQQGASAGVSSTLLDGFQEVPLVLEHAVNRLLDKRYRSLPAAGRNLLEAGFFLR